MRLFVALLIVVCSWAGVEAGSDREGIEATVRKYHQGADEGNVVLLREALHEKF